MYVITYPYFTGCQVNIDQFNMCDIINQWIYSTTQYIITSLYTWLEEFSGHLQQVKIRINV